MQKKSALYRLIVIAVLLALGMVLPFLTGQIPTIGQAISPLHIPAFIAGLTCGWGWGMALGFILPLLRSVIFGMPPLVAVGIPMAFELCAYGVLTGLLYPWLRGKLCKLGASRLVVILATLGLAMVAGRIVGGAAKALLITAGLIPGIPLTFAMFVTSYFVETSLGALVHLIVVPAVVLALEKAHLSPNA